jgi:hypothetical protein
MNNRTRFKQQESTKSTPYESDFISDERYQPKHTNNLSNLKHDKIVNELVLIKYSKSINENDADKNTEQPKSPNQKKRNVGTVILLIFFIFVAIITIAQILVMHGQTLANNFYQIKIMQEELKLMDISMDRMLKEDNILQIDTWYALKRMNENVKRFSAFINDSTGDSSFMSNITHLSALTPTDKHIEPFLNKLKNCFNSISNKSKSKTNELQSKAISNSSDNFISLLLANTSNDLSKQEIDCLQDFVMSVFTSINKNSSLQNNQTFESDKLNNTLNQLFNYLTMPNRDLNKFLVNKKNSSLNPNMNKSLCDSQPPILCKRYSFFNFLLNFHL